MVRKYQNPSSILKIFWQTYYRAWLEWLGKLQTEQCFMWPNTVYLHSITSYYCRPTREEYDLFDHCMWESGEEGRRQKSFGVVGKKNFHFRSEITLYEWITCNLWKYWWVLIKTSCFDNHRNEIILQSKSIQN